MRDYLIDFQNMTWESSAPGVRHKVYTKGHIGYVLEGNISIDFDGRVLTFREGDGFFIS
jgi:uncharacterized cupin superfamily protein